MTDHSCPYYQHGLYIGATTTGDTTLAMCCWQQPEIVTSTVKFDHPILESRRAESVHKVPNDCAPTCSKNGHIANERERALQEFQELYSTQNDHDLRVLHLEQGLTCNLACIGCSPLFSSSWNRHYHLFDSQYPQVIKARYPEQQWQDLDFKNLQRIHFTGGEPLLNHDNVAILRHLDQLGLLSQVSLNYNTNGTIFPDQELLDLWQKCRFVRLYFSLDAVGPAFEYTRYPAQWDQVQENIKQFQQQSQICIIIGVTVTVGIHNIFGLGDFFKWWESQSRLGSQGDSSTVYVRKIDSWSHGGRVLDLQHLTDNQTQLALDHLESVKNYPGIIDVINYVVTNRTPDSGWKDYLDQLDQLRGTNWKHSLSPVLQKD